MVELIRDSYDCVVIGSGYGAAVAAAGMGRAGQSVCLLEKGKERWPGEYPVTFGEISREFHVSGRIKAGPMDLSYIDNRKDTGLYHLTFGQDQSVFVCNGLGGGSLLNGNIFLEATQSVLQMPCWPREIRNNPGCLSKYYDIVRRVLEPEAYPESWPAPCKMKVFERQARAMGLGHKFYRAPQTTRFRSGPNSTGVPMCASTLSGQDCTGVNDGSKSSTLVTYLADAWNRGVEMFCECEVRHIEEVTDERGGYIVYFAWHGRNRDRFRNSVRSNLMWVHAKKAVFLGAGAMGTTEILLRSKARGLRTSDQVGKHMSGNGNILAFGLDGSPFTILRGKFGAFEPCDAVTGTGKLVYDFDMMGVNGKRLHFYGYKFVDSSIVLRPLRFWQATTTLYVTITDPSMTLAKSVKDAVPAVGTEGGSSPSGAHQLHGSHSHYRQAPVATGIVRVHFADLMRAARTLRAPGSHRMERMAKLTAVLWRLWRQPIKLFLAPFMPLQYPLQSRLPDINNTPPTRSFELVASDGVVTMLHMWEPDANAVATDCHGKPVAIRDVFMIPGAGVDHQIFALPTIPFNTVNYLTRAGYRVFVSVHRVCRLKTTHDPWTTYDARLDLKACFETIRTLRGSKKIYTIAHCMGSVAFACGLLDGTIPADWILGITCSQVFMHPVWGTVNKLKSKSPIPLDWLYSKAVGPYFDCSTKANDSMLQRVLNQLLRFYPQQRHEMCNNAVCLRTTFLFGRCWSHRNLNEATHSQIDRVFGGANMTLMHLLMRMGARGVVTGNAPKRESLVTPENIQRLRGVPFLLFSGMDSAVLSPAAADKTYETLLATFGESAGIDGGGTEYRRRKLEGYGHLDCWMGVNAWRDVYPWIREEVDRVVRGDDYVFRQPNDRFTAIVDSGRLLP
ncbi:glucose-methanol-choline oxidoreductase [Purpureocillium lavendulum]|uniref:Glucose-methanol-choline oxidoreductase n=1 Tax=Purpureocillium lavendulum TaxID=1247861 RepID=A0AB34FIC6_9HYPO|nr:glucose-methanol-choline oxidoreductase [Purpureocillium lavendulum]